MSLRYRTVRSLIVIPVFAGVLATGCSRQYSVSGSGLNAASKSDVLAKSDVFGKPESVPSADVFGKPSAAPSNTAPSGEVFGKPALGDVGGQKPSGGDVGGFKPANGGDVGGLKPASGGDVGGLKPASGGDVGGLKPASGGDVGGTKPVGNVGGIKPSTTGLPVESYCAVGQTGRVGSDLVQAKSLVLTVKDMDGNVVCSVTDNVKESIVNNQLVDFRACTKMTGNEYKVTVTDPDSHPLSNSMLGTEAFSTNLLYYPDGENNLPIVISRKDASGTWSVKEPGTGTTTDYALILSEGQCEVSGDPLIIDVGQNALNSRPIDLSSPSLGILFDILGLNSFPVAHTPMRISWMRNTEYMFLVLPDSSGNVRGADQMFGNNNLGPDGKFAPDGFHALAKYDANKDGVIDRQDPIFSQLRLWSDANFDGVAQKGELLTLDQVGLTAIDLRYDRHYKEKDRYGNQVKYKSVAKFSDGSLHLVFDLWFTLKAN